MAIAEPMWFRRQRRSPSLSHQRNRPSSGAHASKSFAYSKAHACLNAQREAHEQYAASRGDVAATSTDSVAAIAWFHSNGVPAAVLFPRGQIPEVVLLAQFVGDAGRRSLEVFRIANDLCAPRRCRRSGRAAPHGQRLRCTPGSNCDLAAAASSAAAFSAGLPWRRATPTARRERKRPRDRSAALELSIP
jgi:hypothetical protein